MEGPDGAEEENEVVEDEPEAETGPEPEPSEPTSDEEEKSSLDDEGLLPVYISFRTYLLVFLLPLGLLALLTLALPSVFYDGFVGPYLWDPITGDSGSSGAAEGYNPINTGTYAVILIGALYGLLFMFRALNLAADVSFVWALTPFLFVGAFWRTLEDARAFGNVTGIGRFLFISPLIYIFLAVVVILSILAGVAGRRLINDRGIGWGLIPLAGVLLVLAAAEQATDMPENIPLWVHGLLLVGVLAGAYFVWRRWPELEKTLPTISGVGLYFAMMGLYLLVVFYVQGWDCMEDGVLCQHAGEPDIAVLWPVLGLDLFAGGLFYAAVLGGRRFWPRFASSATQPIMIMMVFSQFLDAAATFWGIDVLGYGEKHVLPDFLIQTFGTAAVMFPLKLVIIIPGIWLLGHTPSLEIDADIEGDERTSLVLRRRMDRDFWSLIVLVMITLGLAPGGRDVLRSLMGV